MKSFVRANIVTDAVLLRNDGIPPRGKYEKVVDDDHGRGRYCDIIIYYVIFAWRSNEERRGTADLLRGLGFGRPMLLRAYVRIYYAYAFSCVEYTVCLVYAQ